LHETVLDYIFDPNLLSFQKQGDTGKQAELHFVVRAFDLQGNLRSADSKTVQMTLTSAKMAEIQSYGNVGYSQKIELVPGDYLLELGIRDLRTNLVGTVSARVHIPEGLQ
jgi:hypothetical protein